MADILATFLSGCGLSGPRHFSPGQSSHGQSGPRYFSLESQQRPILVCLILTPFLYHHCVYVSVCMGVSLGQDVWVGVYVWVGGWLGEIAFCTISNESEHNSQLFVQ